MKLTVAEEARLAEQPWLEPFIEDNDASLDAAEKRWKDATSAAWTQVRAQHLDVHNRVRVRGLETTAVALGEAEDR